MDRNNPLLKIVRRSILVISVITTIHACNFEGPSEKDLVGKWYSPEYGTIELKQGGTFKFYNLTKEILPFPEKHSFETFDGIGTWKLIKNMDLWTLDVTFLKGEYLKNGHAGTIMDVKGNRGILGNKPPWILVHYIGDPDDNLRIEFKQKNKTYED